MTSEEKRDAIVAAAEDKKANYVTPIDLRGQTIITEGYSEATWIILDYGDSIVHVMAEDERGYYNLEKLWASRASAQDEDEMGDAAAADTAPAAEAEDAVAV